MELVGTCGKEEKEMVSEVDLVVMEVEKEDRVLVGTMVLVEIMVMVLVETVVLVVEKVSGKEMGKEVTIRSLKLLLRPTTEILESTLHLLDL